MHVSTGPMSAYLIPTKEKREQTATLQTVPGEPTHIHRGAINGDSCTSRHVCARACVFCLPQLPEGNDLKFSHKIAISVLYGATLAWVGGRHR